MFVGMPIGSFMYLAKPQYRYQCPWYTNCSWLLTLYTPYRKQLKEAETMY